MRDRLEGAQRAGAGRDHGRATVTAKRLGAAARRRRRRLPSATARSCLLTFASGRRRAEIVGLNVKDLDFGRPGFLIVTIRKSNTYQGGAGQFVAIRRIERGAVRVAAVEAWLAICEQKNGALFVAFSPHGELRKNRIDGRRRSRTYISQS